MWRPRKTRIPTVEKTISHSDSSRPAVMITYLGLKIKTHSQYRVVRTMFSLNILTSVGKVEEHDRRTQDGVQSAGGSKINSTESDGDEGSQDQRGQRDVEAFDDFAEQSRAGQTTVTCKRPGHSTGGGDGACACEELASNADNLQACLRGRNLVSLNR